MIETINTLERGRLGPVLLDLNAVNARTRFAVRGAKSGRVVVRPRGTGSPTGTMYVKRCVPGDLAQDFSSAKTISTAGGSADLSSDDLRGEESIEVGYSGGALASCWAEVTVTLDYDVTPVTASVPAGTIVRDAAATGGVGGTPLSR